jgi:HEPN domain-containing protein
MDNNELSLKVFHERAVQSYIAARLMLATNILSPIGLYNAHLACECMLKSLISQSGSTPRTIHNLAQLLEDLKRIAHQEVLDDDDLLEILNWLNPYQELGRYGALARPANDPGRIDTPAMQVRAAISYQPSEDIKKIDSVFFKLRSLAVDQDDLITKTANGTTDPRWVYPIPLNEIIFHGTNIYLSIDV